MSKIEIKMGRGESPTLMSRGPAEKLDEVAAMVDAVALIERLAADLAAMTLDRDQWKETATMIDYEGMVAQRDAARKALSETMIWIGVRQKEMPTSLLLRVRAAIDADIAKGAV